ncbi:polyamine ABC transporter substrate-binding protein [Neisseria sp. Dent CA1/247]|uniref:polyamine ABC transporter substrate-binding protein n=1 Tax=Neisseria sp. Dent CA1/247 TaxID=2912675 RepID=UPI001FCFB2BB|nr:polyamine ABC transporter substrate-binding protein [Neisseria sp. Dent CA1/247]UOO78160.1 polyamine ABC transporter substrate-binding protein [Neisseria sp. Dent CA1/247]
MPLKLSFLVLSLSLLAACGGRSSDKPEVADAQNRPSETAPAQHSNLPQTDALKIYNWSDYVDPKTVKHFEEQFGVKVTYDIYESDETLESKVLTGKSGYDVVGPSNAFVSRQIKAGAYQKIDKSLIPNYRHISPKLLDLMKQVDAGNEYAVPFFWGTNTFAINTERVKRALGTDKLPDNQWDLVFNPTYTAKLKKCGISYLDSAAEMYPMVLNYLGKNPNSSKPEDIQAATDVLKANRANVKRFTSSGFIDALARGDTCVTVGFGGDLNIAKRRAAEAGGKEKIRVMMPKEGVGIWVDSFAIPKDAHNVLNAHRYINHFLEPEIAAKNGNFVTYAPSSMPAKDLMDKEYSSDNSIFPSDEDLANSFIMVPLEPEALKEMVRQWQQIKVAK